MYVSRILREARADAVDSVADTQFLEQLLDALVNERPVKAAIRALIPTAARSSRR